MRIYEAIRESLKDDLILFWQQDGFPQNEEILIQFSTDTLSEFKFSVTSNKASLPTSEHLDITGTHNVIISLSGITQTPNPRDLEQIADSHFMSMCKTKETVSKCQLRHQLILNEYTLNGIAADEALDKLKAEYGSDVVSPYLRGRIKPVLPSDDEFIQYSKMLSKGSIHNLAMSFWAESITTNLPHPVFFEKYNLHIHYRSKLCRLNTI